MCRPYCIGLTGGIGSGKSTVADLLAALGAHVVDTDVIARELTVSGGKALPAIVDQFGEGMLNAEGSLDRAAMRAKIFADAHARTRLENILHPLIRAEAASRIAAGRSPYVVLVVPLLVENLSAYRALIDRIAVVRIDEAQQMARILQRPGLDATQAQGILAAQTDAESRLAVADDVIDNRGDMNALRTQIELLHRSYLALATEKCGDKKNNPLR